ncbi:MAG: DUF6867 family protein [Magnetospiraceae bacterium]
MEQILGTSIGVSIFMTLCVMGFAAYMTGQAIAITWRPVWQVYVYALLLGCADRFLIFGLFGGELLSITGYIVDTIILTVVGLASYRLNQVGKMVAQYPWLYERTGAFSWRERLPSGTPDS